MTYPPPPGAPQQPPHHAGYPPPGAQLPGAHPQSGWGAPPPPKKGNTGLVIGLAPPAAPQSAPPTAGGAAPVAVIQDFIAKVNAREEGGVVSLACPGRAGLVEPGYTKAAEKNVTLRALPPRPSGPNQAADVEAVGGGSVSGSVTVRSEDSGATWCVFQFMLLVS